MRKLVSAIVLLTLVSLGVSQQSREESALDSMVKTERAFAAMSAEKGTRSSFMSFIADNGILFRPTAVKGKQWMTEHPVPATNDKPLLSWWPIYADMSRSGDMGYTTGPWEFKENISDPKPVGFGNFLTVWKKQGDGTWKFAIDLGISNPEPESVPRQLEPPANTKQAAVGGSKNVKSETAALLAREQKFSKAAASQGAHKAFAEYASPDVRVFRNKHVPFIGKTSADVALPQSSTVWSWEPAFADVSGAGDLGYSYGTYWLRPKDDAAKILETGNYYRIWKKQGGSWKVVADLLDPVAEPKKN